MADIPDKNLIEINSICHLKTAILKTMKAKPEIYENDKTPSWDGNIEVYNSTQILKTSLIGLVPVQVKGHWANNINKETINFAAEVADLRNYQNNGGVMFFVIYCHGFDNAQIYYNSLLPLDLDRLLDGIENQKKKNIKLSKLPQNNPDEVYRILKDFLFHSPKQAQRDKRIKTFCDLKEYGFSNCEITFGYGGGWYPSFEETADYMLRHKTYAYAKPNGLNVCVPINQVQIYKIGQDIDIPVIVEGELLYKSITANYFKEKRIINIGNNIHIDFVSNEINYYLGDMLSERIKDLKILVAIFLNKNIFPIDVISFSVIHDEQKLNEFKSLLKASLEAKKALDILGVTEDLNITKMNDDDDLKLKAVVESVSYNKPVPCSFNGKAGVGFIEISNLKILILCSKTKIKDNFLISNIYKGEFKGAITDEVGRVFDISPYLKLTRNSLKHISNFNYMKIIESITSKPVSNIHNTLILEFVLELLYAYDKCEKINLEMLNTAKILIDFLISNSIIESDILTLNMLQIKKRQAKLTKEDKLRLIEIKTNSSDSMIKLGVSILIDNYEEADYFYNTLSDENKIIFDKFPISNLWQGHK